MTATDEAATDEAAAGRRHRRPRLALVGATILVLIAVLIAAQNSTVLFPDFWSYRPLDERTIAVRVFVAPCSWTRITGVTEGAMAIAVRIETLPCPQLAPGTGGLDARELTVSLHDGLGNRFITDTEGQAIPRRTEP